MITYEQEAEILEKIMQFEKELAEMKEEHTSSWMEYGSELSSGEFERREKKLQDKINNLKDQLKNG